MKKSPIRKVSPKKRVELRYEKELTLRLIVKQGGKCAECGRNLGWGSAKHEIKFRSHGGDPTDEGNCVLLCIVCHGKKHGENLIMEE